jgi:hypothetical protein
LRSSVRSAIAAVAGDRSRLGVTHPLVRSRDDGVDWMVAEGRAAANLYESFLHYSALAPSLIEEAFFLSLFIEMSFINIIFFSYSLRSPSLLNISWWFMQSTITFSCGFFFFVPLSSASFS